MASNGAIFSIFLFYCRYFQWFDKFKKISYICILCVESYQANFVNHNHWHMQDSLLLGCYGVLNDEIR